MIIVVPAIMQFLSFKAAKQNDYKNGDQRVVNIAGMSGNLFIQMVSIVGMTGILKVVSITGMVVTMAGMDGQDA